MTRPTLFRRGREAAPSTHRRSAQVLHFARPAARRVGVGWFPLVLIGLPLLVFAAVLFAPFPTTAPLAAQGARAGEEHRAMFPVCAGGSRVTCVVDGDTIWYRGTKIRLADIDTPEVSQPACPREAMLGRQATERLRGLLNAGPFGLAVPPDGRSRDRYGRELRILTRGGESLGSVLVREGLAERWGGPRIAWCGA